MKLIYSLKLPIVSLVLLVASAGVTGYGQTEVQNRAGQASKSYDLQVYVLIASAGPSGLEERPKILDGVVRQLNEMLPFRNYRVGMTFLGRFQDRGSIDVTGSATPQMFSQVNLGLPVFYELSFNGTRVDSSVDNRAVISFDNFRFSLSAPVPNPPIRSQGSESPPVVNGYHNSAIKTSITISEGAPSIVSTLHTGQPDEQLVIVALVRRSSN